MLSASRTRVDHELWKACMGGKGVMMRARSTCTRTMEENETMIDVGCGRMIGGVLEANQYWPNRIVPIRDISVAMRIFKR